MFLQTVIKVVY